MDEKNIKMMAFAGGQRQFRCRIPSARGKKGGSKTEEVPKLERHARTARLASLKGRCIMVKKDYWTYNLCFGRKLTQFNVKSGATFSMGELSPDAEQMHPDGSITQLYTGGSQNRSTILQYKCGGGSVNSESVEVDEPEVHKYTITIRAPQFCHWREASGTQARDADGRMIKVASLLEGLRGACVNTTQGWWTYEYCFPHTLRQFHVHGSTRDPNYSLGSINGTKASQELDQVEMGMVRPKASAGLREQRSLPSRHRALRQTLGGGTMCDETQRPRSTTMYFECPANWQTRREPRFVSITESALCEYEVLIHTDLLCAHPRLLPALPRGKEVIQCDAASDD